MQLNISFSKPQSSCSVQPTQTTCCPQISFFSKVFHCFIHSSIHDAYRFSVRVMGKLETIPADFWWEVGYMMGRPPIHLRANTNLLQLFTSMGNLDHPLHVICMWLDCERKTMQTPHRKAPVMPAPWYIKYIHKNEVTSTFGLYLNTDKNKHLGAPKRRRYIRWHRVTPVKQ